MKSPRGSLLTPPVAVLAAIPLVLTFLTVPAAGAIRAGTAAPVAPGVASAAALDTSAQARSARTRFGRGRRSVGFSPGFSILYQERAQLRRDLRGMRRLGARRIRIDLSWALVEREEGRFDWSRTDRVLRQARAVGLQVLPVIGYQPSWAGSRSVDTEGFAAFAAAAARRYSDDVRVWEVWNEPNLERFWFGRPDPVAYGRLVAATSDAIRGEDPRAGIAIGSLAPAVDAGDGSQISPETFLRRAGSVLAPGQFNAVSVHPYSYPALPRARHDWNTFHRIPQLRDLARRIGGARTRLWLTEYGAPTGASDRAVRPRRQARMLVQAVRATRRMRGVGPIFLYAYRDVARDPADPEANFGLIRHGGERKRSWYALRNALSR